VHLQISQMLSAARQFLRRNY